MVTFKEYLAERKAGYDAEGDFARLAMADPDLPDIATLEELTAYVERRGGYPAV